MIDASSANILRVCASRCCEYRRHWVAVQTPRPHVSVSGSHKVVIQQESSWVASNAPIN